MAPCRVFRYQPTCNVRECRAPAVYKIAAPWSDGTSRELKNYGLACEAHRASQFELARRACQGLHLAEGETVGPIETYLLENGRRDAELSRAPASAPLTES
jgi:hypothetical protein